MSEGFKACLTRSYSCPNLSVIDMKSPLQRRKRACSESFYDGRPVQRQTKRRDTWKAWDAQIVSRHSETNLLRIDKEKTFQQQNVSRNSENILEQVVIALNNLNIELNELSSPCNKVADSSIINPESQSALQIESRKRLRAKSLYPHQIYGMNDEKPTQQLTWSGDDYAIQHYLNAQYIDKSNDDKPDAINSPGNRRKSIISVFNSVFKRRNTLFSSIGDIESVPEQTNMEIEEPHSQNICNPYLDKLKHRAYNRDFVHGRGTTNDISNHLTESTSSLARAIEVSQSRNILGKQKPTFPYIPKCDLMSINGIRIVHIFTFCLVIICVFNVYKLLFPGPINEHMSNISKPPTQPFTPSKMWPSSQTQGWTRGRFSVSRVIEDPTSSVMQHRPCRRFSAFPTASYVSRRMMTHTTISNSTAPWKRGQFKSTISPLVLCTSSLNNQTTSLPLDRK